MPGTLARQDQSLDRRTTSYHKEFSLLPFIKTFAKQLIGYAVVRSLELMSGFQDFGPDLEGGAPKPSLLIAPRMRPLGSTQVVEKVFGVRQQQ